MSSVDTRDIARDSLFLFADLVFEGRGEKVKVKVRNLSKGGMMAEGAFAVTRGERLTVDLRNVGEVRGSVAWVQGNRFGVAFETEIDPKLVRAPVTSGQSEMPRFMRPALDGSRVGDEERHIRTV